MDQTNQEFLVKNCSLAAIATGESASSLIELRDKIATVEEGCIYHHFWGGRMNIQFVHPQHHNDFAHWVYHRLHDHVLAERLNIIDPTEFNSLEELRQELLETIEKRLDDYEIILWTKKEDRFHFIRSTVIVFESTLSIKNPEDLSAAVRKLPTSSIFYHFIDARSRTSEKIDDFSTWLKTFDDLYIPLIEQIRALDPYFLSLTTLRDELANTLTDYFEKKHDVIITEL